MDKVLKQRLIGASILIALAVIFVPMFFDGPEQQQVAREMSIDLPNAPDDRGPVRRLPLDPDRGRETAPDARARPPTQEQGRSQPDVPGDDVDDGNRSEENPASADELMAEIEASQDRLRSAPPEPVNEQEEDESQADEQTADVIEADPDEGRSADPGPSEEAGSRAEPVAAAPLDADSEVSSGWVVQVASFSSQTNADEVAEQLTSLGHVASIDLIVRGQSELYRVRTGPYDRRDEADRARGQIEQTVAGVDPVVMGGPAVELPSAPTESGYAVQVGSFASRDNALRLLDQLSGQDYEVFIHQDVAGSRTIWRVRVGPLGSRDEAQARLAELVERTGIDGLVVSHP